MGKRDADPLLTEADCIHDGKLCSRGFSVVPWRADAPRNRLNSALIRGYGVSDGCL